MFELSFWEIALIALVALIVVGPERLPGLARSAGQWLGKARRFVTSVKADIDRELQTEELRRLVDKQAQDMAHLREMLDETKSAMNPQPLLGAQSGLPAVVAESPETPHAGTSPTGPTSTPDAASGADPKSQQPASPADVEPR